MRLLRSQYEVKEGRLPALDDAFVANFNIKEGGIDALKRYQGKYGTRTSDAHL